MIDLFIWNMFQVTDRKYGIGSVKKPFGVVFTDQGLFLCYSKLKFRINFILLLILFSKVERKYIQFYLKLGDLN